MYSDGGTGDRWGATDVIRGPPGKRQERYTRNVDELDYIVPRGGYYFEHDDRDVWKPKRPMRRNNWPQNEGPGDRSRPPGAYNAAHPHNDRHQMYRDGNGLNSRAHDRYRRGDSSKPAAGPSNRARSPPPRADGPGRYRDRAEGPGRERTDRADGQGRDRMDRERDRSPIGRGRGGQPEPDPDVRGPTAPPPRTRLRSTVVLDGDVKVAAPPPQDSEPAEPSRARHRHKGEDRWDDSRAGADAARPSRPVGLPTGGQDEVTDDVSGQPAPLRRFVGRLGSSVVTRDLNKRQDAEPVRTQQGDSVGGPSGRGPAPYPNGAPTAPGRMAGRLGARLGAAQPDARQPETRAWSRPGGGMRSDAAGKWGHDLFASVAEEEPDQERRGSISRLGIL